jgi:hypothetical protein
MIHVAVKKLGRIPNGQTMQCDLWFPHEPLPLGHGQKGKPPALVMTSAFSGYIQARMLPTRTTFKLLGGMWSLLQEAGAVPKQLVWDNESGIDQGRLTEPVAAFAGVLGGEIRQLPPRDPESKGRVERMNRYFRQGFGPCSARNTPRRTGTSGSAPESTPMQSWTASCTTPSGSIPATTTCVNTPP